MLVMIGTDCTGDYKSNYHTTVTAVFFDVALFHLRVTFCFHHVFFLREKFMEYDFQRLEAYHLDFCIIKSRSGLKSYILAFKKLLHRYQCNSEIFK